MADTSAELPPIEYRSERRAGKRAGVVSFGGQEVYVGFSFPVANAWWNGARYARGDVRGRFGSRYKAWAQGRDAYEHFRETGKLPA